MNIFRTFREEIIEYSKPEKLAHPHEHPPTIWKCLLITSVLAYSGIFLAAYCHHDVIGILLVLPLMIFGFILITAQEQVEPTILPYLEKKFRRR